MLSFLQRDLPGLAAIYFPGNGPPPDGAFARLASLGISAEEDRVDETHWALKLGHPEWGTATLVAPREPIPVDEVMAFAISITDAEKAAAADANAVVHLSVPARKKHILRDRKLLLRWAQAVMGEDGILAVDMSSTLPWSRAGLADELAHDADLDVEAIYCIHQVMADEDGRTEWLHTHGLAEVGGFDFDVLRPHPAFVAACSEPFRALAFQVIGGEVTNRSDRHPLGSGFDIRLVPAGQFRRSAAPEDLALMDDPNGFHIPDRAVICEPAGRKLFGFGGGGDQPRPHRLPQKGEISDRAVLFFPTWANEVVAERARATISLLPAYAEEFAEFEVQPILKIGYPTDSGETREHLWFSFHGLVDGQVDATLESEPYAIAGMKTGQRGLHSLDQLSDWIVITPAGWITPRSQRPARTLRENREEIRADLAKWMAEQGRRK
jgi:hypothetical protein